MFAKLSALVGGGPALNYNVEPEPYEVAWGCWTHFPGSSREDGSPVSVFRIAATDPNDLKLIAARNGVKRLRMLRHPNILAFKDSIEVQEKGQQVLYLVTEAVRPLITVLKELDLAGKHRDEYLATGVLHMTNAVSFLNNSCNMIHGYVCMAAVVVTDTLDWKLHGFDITSEHALTGDFALQHASWMVGSQYKPGEVAKQEWSTVQQGPSWAVDSWGLGCMMQEVFSGEPLRAVEQLRRTDVIPPALLADYQKLLSSQVGRRLNPAKVAESKFLNNRLVEVVAFMENIALKDGSEKDIFFKKLPAMIPAIPEPVAVRKILPQLSNALEYGGAPATAVSSLLMIGRMLEGDEFVRRVVPSLSRLFASSDRNLRRNLLEAIDSFGPHLTQDVIENQIYPPLSNGFSDEIPYIRELTLKSLLTLAPKMKQSTLTSNLLKHLSRLQVDQEPSIRANTTVLLGNIAQYLGEQYCKKVLLNAFGRALKDSFPPARCAALRALSATLKYYSAEEIACRALPAVSPLCVDPLADVRAAALSCLEGFSGALKTNHETKLQQEAAAAAAAGGGPAGAAGMGAAAAGSGGVGTNSSGMLGWAMSSLAASSAALIKGGGASGSPRAVPAAAAAAAGGGGPAMRAGPNPAGFAGGSGGARISSTSGSSNVGGPVTPAAGGSSGGLGAGGAAAGAGAAGGGAADGWDEDFEEMEDAAEIEARNRLSRLNMSSRPQAAPAAPTSSSSRPAAAPRGSSGGGLGGPAAPAAAASGGWDAAAGDGGDGWGDMDLDLGGGGGGGSGSRVSSSSPMGQGGASAVGRTSSSSGSGVGHASTGAAAARPRPVRPAGGSAGLGAKSKTGGAMKLGASKLGAQKVQPGASSFDNEEW